MILLGGPNGIGSYLDQVRQILADGSEGSKGLHCGILPVRLPGGKQHSYVALCDIFMWHDRQQLLPNLTDMQFDSVYSIYTASTASTLSSSSSFYTCLILFWLIIFSVLGWLRWPVLFILLSCQPCWSVECFQISLAPAELRIRLGPFRFAKQADELARLLAFNMQEIQKKLQDPPDPPQSTLASSASSDHMATGKDLQISKASESYLSDEEIATQFEQEILRHGGYIECNLLYVCNPGLRKLLGERKLLQFLKAQPDIFYLGTSDGKDIVGTLRLAATEPASTQGQTLTASTALGRQAMRDLEDAVAEFCASWVPKTAAHNAPFLPRVARGGRVYKKLQAFVRHCPVSSLKAKTSETSETRDKRDTWVMELLHLRLFLLDRPLTFVVSDSGNPCNKGLKNCCCHLKVALSKEAAVQLETKADRETKENQRQNAKSAENPISFRSLVDVASLPQLFCDGDIFVIDKPSDLSSQILQRVYQKMADEEGRGRQIHCCLENSQSIHGSRL